MEARKYKCCKCGYEHPNAKYFKSQSPLFSGIGHLPICKDCLEREFKKYKAIYQDPKKAMQRLCMAFDIYYDAALFDSCSGNDGKVVGRYLARTHLGQYSNRTFDTSVEEGFLFMDSTEGVPDSSKNPNMLPSQKLIEKWGDGLSEIDYAELEKHYKSLKAANPNTDSNQDIFIIELCYTKMQQMRAVREGRVDDYKKLSDAYRQSFSQAGLKNERDSPAAESFSFGLGIETIEKMTPAEYYKNKGLYKDFDSLGEYFSRMLVRPIKNLMFGTNDRDTEYYVKDEGESDEYSDE